MTFLNIAAYKFIPLDELPTLRTALKARAYAFQLRGTILLSPEGINFMLVGLFENINAFRATLAKNACFADLHYKESYSSQLTYHRLLVKIKKEIIAFGVDTIQPAKQQAPYVSPQQLKQWLDHQKDILLLDARNDYEIQHGTFINAKRLNIQHFRDFPLAAKTLAPELKEKTIVAFCTGGIRCEKAALLLQQAGFKHVYQLQGGILDYFQACGGAYFQGNCYVFDQRISVDPHLNETEKRTA